MQCRKTRLTCNELYHQLHFVVLIVQGFENKKKKQETIFNNVRSRIKIKVNIQMEFVSRIHFRVSWYTKPSSQINA